MEYFEILKLLITKLINYVLLSVFQNNNLKDKN